MPLHRIILASALSFLFLVSSKALLADEIPAPEFAQKMRQLLFDITPEHANLKSTAEFRVVFGVVMDWPIEGFMATVASFSDGTASVYTTSGISIAGGYWAAASAKAFVHQAERNLSNSTVAKDNPYPANDKVRFYIRTFTGLRVIEEPLDKLLRRQSKYDSMFAAANQVMTELFETAEKVKK